MTAGAEVGDAQGDAAERHDVPVGDDVGREAALVRPLLAEHGAKDLLLHVVVAADRLVHAGDGEDRDVVGPDELDDAAVVVGVGVRHDDGLEGLAERGDPVAEGTSVRDGERAVDGYDPVLALDEVGVDQRAGIRVDPCVGGGAQRVAPFGRVQRAMYSTHEGVGTCKFLLEAPWLPRSSPTCSTGTAGRGGCSRSSRRSGSRSSSTR
jgi:hypothetical protein